VEPADVEERYIICIKIVIQENNMMDEKKCFQNTDSKVRELIAVKVLHTSMLNTTVVAYKLLPLGSYAPMPAPIPPFKTILELVLWNGLQSCRCITPDVVSVIKMPSFNISFIFGNRKKSLGTRTVE